MAVALRLVGGAQGRMGDLTWPVVQARVDGAVVVTEEEIVSAMQLCYERMKVGEHAASVQRGLMMLSAMVQVVALTDQAGAQGVCVTKSV